MKIGDLVKHSVFKSASAGIIIGFTNSGCVTAKVLWAGGIISAESIVLLEVLNECRGFSSGSTGHQ